MRFVRVYLPALILSLTLPLGSAREISLAAAQALIAAQRVPEAREPLEMLVASDPDNLEARLTLAGVYNSLGRRDDGIRLLEPLLETHPNDARVLGIYAGQSMLRAGELRAGFRALRLARRGRELMERAVILAPDEIAYREGLVDFYRQAPMIAGGSLAKAREHAAALAKLDPVRGGAWLAAILVEEGKYPEALAVCDTALATRPDDYVALFTFGKTVSESGLRLDDGEAALRRCLSRVPGASEPSHANVWYQLGRIAEQRGDLVASSSAYQASLKLEPGFHRPAEALKRLR